MLEFYFEKGTLGTCLNNLSIKFWAPGDPQVETIAVNSHIY